MQMNARSIDSLGAVAAEMGMRGAAEYIRRHGLKLDDKDVCDAIKRHLKASLSQAIDDAKLAYDAGMSAAGQQTFLLSMRLAGVAAAKEVEAEEAQKREAWEEDCALEAAYTDSIVFPNCGSGMPAGYDSWKLDNGRA